MVQKRYPSLTLVCTYILDLRASLAPPGWGAISWKIMKPGNFPVNRLHRCHHCYQRTVLDQVQTILDQFGTSNQTRQFTCTLASSLPVSSEDTNLRISSIQVSTSSASVKNWWKSTASVNRRFLESIISTKLSHFSLTSSNLSWTLSEPKWPWSIRACPTAMDWRRLFSWALKKGWNWLFLDCTFYH